MRVMESSLRVSVEAGDELLAQEIEEVASLEEMPQRAWRSLQIVRGHGVGLGLGPNEVIFKGWLKQCSYLHCDLGK